MTRLYKHLRVHQIFGANTNVGKTILATALCRTSALARKRVFYVKPIATGPSEDADDGHVKRYSGQFRDLVQTDCLFRYNKPVSPHLAAQACNKSAVPCDEVFVDSVANHIDKCARVMSPSVLYVETAGGPHSPVMSGSTQADAYRPLLLPTILVGDSKLGGISSTISAYESLLLRGYRIDGVIMFRESYYQNFEYLGQYFTKFNIPFTTIPPPPEEIADKNLNCRLTEQYYSETVDSQYREDLQCFESFIDGAHLQRLADLESMAKRTLETVWWPFVQHGSVNELSDVTVIDSGWGDHFSVYEPVSTNNSEASSISLLTSKFDGSASWWTQAVGHGNSSLALAAAKAAGRYGHVMFPQASHAPALRLAERLVHCGPGTGWASRAYFSDDGSTGMEIALKMALRAFSKREAWNKHAEPELGVIGVKGSYHGDTIGAMDACEEGVFTCEWHNAKGYWFDPPTVGISAGHPSVNLPPSLSPSSQSTIRFQTLSALYDVETRLHSPLAITYQTFISRTLSKLQRDGRQKLAALVLEPLVMGAGGMIFVDPLFQRILVNVVRTELNQSANSKKGGWQGVPVVFDEVFVGIHRIGVESCTSLLGVKPDIAVYAKMLTGGLVPMAVTLASESIFEAFKGNLKAEALLHGHSYTAHPVGCEVANETLDIIDKLAHSHDWIMSKSKWQVHQASAQQPTSSVWSFWEPTFVYTLSLNPSVQEVMTLGTVLVFKFRDNVGGYVSESANSALAFMKASSISDGLSGSFGVHFRTLGNVAYFMCSLNTSSRTLRALESSIVQGLTPKSYAD